MNIPDTTCHKMTVQFPTSPNVCFCTTGGKHNKQNTTFYSTQYDCLTRKTHFIHISDTLVDNSSSCPFFNCLQWNCLKCCLLRTQARRRFLHSLTAVSIMFCSRPIQLLLDVTNIPKLYLVITAPHDSQSL